MIKVVLRLKVKQKGWVPVLLKYYSSGQCGLEAVSGFEPEYLPKRA
jgi:hypothetical protein